MIAAALLVACGFLRTAGSVGDQHLILAAEGTERVLYGKAADEIIGWPGEVCVQFEADGPRLPGNAIAVTGYRLRGDGSHSPIVGRIAVRRSGRFEIQTDDGKHFAVRGEASALQAVAGRHIWLLARWRAGALEPIQFGLLGTQSG
jgi:hypothetical protein